LGFYNALLIGAIYEFSASDIDVKSTRSFFGALKRCIYKHPSLSFVIQDKHTDKAFFERVPTIRLEDHITMIEETDPDASVDEDMESDELMRIERSLPSILDHSWPQSLPPWRIVVLPLASDADHKRCFVAFTYSHGLGDGINGLAFHRTFMDGIHDQVDEDSSTLSTPVADFPPPFDTAKRLPISWWFLLTPLIAVLMPKFLSEVIGIRASTSTVDSSTWVGSRMFIDPTSFKSNPKLVEIKGVEVENAVRVARRNGAKLTATIHQVMVRALSKALPGKEMVSFVSGTAVNMRRSLGISDDEMGFFTNAYFDYHSREDSWASPISDQAWACARSLTEKLAECAISLQDQPVGLLRYIPSIRRWTASKIGQRRDCSYEISNLGAFDPRSSRAAIGGNEITITKMVFSRPVNAISAPLSFSIVSVKGSSLILSIVWQPGALGIPVECESTLVDELVSFFKEDIKNLK
jgi:hypothetical protein